MARVNPRLIVLMAGDTGTETDRSLELSKCEFHSAEADIEFVSFQEAREGGARTYTAQLTIAQDHATGTLWREIWDNAGATISGIYQPYGNVTPTAAQPHYTFDAVISEPDGLLMGGEGTTSTRAVASVEVEWELEAKPVEDTGI